MAAAVLLASAGAQAQNLSDIFGALGNLGGNSSQTTTSGNGGGNTLGNLLEGVFSSSNITVQDLAGVWTSNGPAVCFQSENMLKKAGGIAAAAMVEKELSPYYSKLGLNGTVITIQTDGTFSMKTKMVTLNGTITQSSKGKGVFDFNFTMLGMKLATVTTYAEKTSKTLNIMFDASKLTNLLSAISKVVNIKTLSAITKILDMYDGLCVGFRTEKTGTVAGEQQSTGSSALNALGNILRGGNSSNQNNSSNSGSSSNSSNSGNSSNSTNSTNSSNQSNQSDSSSSLGTLINILGNRNRK